ncbi:TniQ family protein [Acinetobacter defluvii]|uniref:TniQ family protein n=1 Tax=Acinetobacter defluvii TaxID=1871111 RepID=UPI003AF6CD86
MQNSLLIQAIPYEDESPISFLLRTAKLNAHSSIFNLVGKENYQSIIKKSLNYHLADHVRFSLVLNALNIDNDYLCLAFERSGPTNRSPRTIGAIEVPHELFELDNIRYCPICLGESAYLKKLWMLKPIYACPIHLCFLIDSCPNCENPITLKAGIQNCACCGFELNKAPTRETKSIETINWFIDVVNFNSNKLFKEFAACWNAFNNFFKFDGSNTNLKVFLSVYEYFHHPELSALKLSALINSRINYSHPRVQLIPFLKYKSFFKKHIKVVEQNADEYKINEKSISIKLRNHQIKRILKVSRFELEKLIESDYLKLEKKELYRGNISSIDIERFLLGLIDKDESIANTLSDTTFVNDHICLNKISEFLEINYETARKLANIGWFNLEQNELDVDVPKQYSKSKLKEFDKKYMLNALLAKRLKVNPTNLVEKLASIDITPVHGPHIDSTPINIFLKTDVQDISTADLEAMQHYPTRTGRQKDKPESITTSTDYYSLKEAAALLGISPNRVAVLVKKGILSKDKNNPLSVQIQTSSLLNLKKKLDSEDHISYSEAAKQLSCPINWMKKYWCETGFLHIVDLVYWKLINKNELTEVLKLKEEYVTGAEASILLGMRHSHITNLQNQNLIRPYYLCKTDKKVRLFKKVDILKLCN